MRAKDCTYLWCEACAIELSNGSNGWFRFLLDGKLSTMYSSGSPEGGTEASAGNGTALGLKHSKVRQKYVSISAGNGTSDTL